MLLAWPLFRCRLLCILSGLWVHGSLAYGPVLEIRVTCVLAIAVYHASHHLILLVQPVSVMGCAYMCMRLRICCCWARLILPNVAEFL